MSVPKSQRWVAEGFRRTVGPFTLHVRPSNEVWVWSISRSDTKATVQLSTKPDEKAAKLAATRAVEKLMRGVR